MLRGRWHLGWEDLKAPYPPKRGMRHPKGALAALPCGGTARWGSPPFSQLSVVQVPPAHPLTPVGRTMDLLSRGWHGEASREPPGKGIKRRNAREGWEPSCAPAERWLGHVRALRACGFSAKPSVGGGTSRRPAPPPSCWHCHPKTHTLWDFSGAAQPEHRVPFGMKAGDAPGRAMPAAQGGAGSTAGGCLRLVAPSLGSPGDAS